MVASLKTFAYFGAKTKVAPQVWEAFGNVNTYVEPFFGSGAVLLARPQPPKFEIVNDVSCYIVNFFRAVKKDPDGVAGYADCPKTELDFNSRHKWLLEKKGNLYDLLMESPEACDVKAAGWWLWGMGLCIGLNWCTRPYAPAVPDGRGAGGGIHAMGRREHVASHMRALADRLRYTLICCGDWEKVVAPSYLGTTRVRNCGQTPTGVFLDPPYAGTAVDTRFYGELGEGLTKRVEAWALANGEDKDLRIALCGYEGDYDLPSWRKVAWSTHAGYGNQNKTKAHVTHRRERIWFSPHCVAQGEVFSWLEKVR